MGFKLVLKKVCIVFGNEEKGSIFAAAKQKAVMQKGRQKFFKCLVISGLI